LPMYTAHCSQCSYVARARTRTAMLNKIRKHLWKKHRTWMISRIKAGKRKSKDNPTVQDFISALSDAPGRAFKIYKTLQKRDFTIAKQVMDALETSLPIEIRISWKAIEAIHDELYA